MPQPLELLAPAKNLECGIAAIDHGSDAVYIGAPILGARAAVGNSVDDMIEELEPLGVDAIGMNCSIGPDLAIPVMKKFVGKTNLPLIFKPNAGKPILSSGGAVAAPYTAKTFADEVAPALDFVDYIGGCCGSDPSYIKELASRMGR